MISETLLMPASYDFRNFDASPSVTKAVIAHGDMQRHKAAVLDHIILREELIRRLENRKLKAADVAKRLGVAPARITEMKNRTRRVQPEELEPLADLLQVFPQAAQMIMLPVALPNEDALATMMHGLLLGVGLEDAAVSHARTLARRLPGALVQIAGDLVPEQSGAETSDAERLQPPAKPHLD